MTTATAVKETTHGTMSINFSAIGINADDLAAKFHSLLLSEMELNITNINGEKIELETFDYSIERLETFKDDDWT